MTKQGIRTLWNSTIIAPTGKRSALAVLNTTTNANDTIVDPLTNAFILGGGLAAYQPSYIVSDGPSFNTHTTREDEPILLRLDASSLLFSSVARVITSLPQVIICTPLCIKHLTNLFCLERSTVSSSRERRVLV